MSDQYRLMVYFAVATLHLYRKSLRHYEFGESIEDFMKRNSDVFERATVEAKNLFNYTLSFEQMKRAAASYLAPGQSIEDFGPYRLAEDKDSPST